MSFKMLQQVSLRNQYSCYGWIRNNENILNLSHVVPDLVKSICVLYFRDEEIFNKTSTTAMITLSSSKKIISRSNRETGFGITNIANTWILDNGFCNYVNEASLHNNHGINEINSDQEITVEWLLKANLTYPNNSVRQGSNYGNILIGITNKDDHINKHIDDGHTIYYLFNWIIGQNSMINETQPCLCYWSMINKSWVNNEIFEEYGTNEYPNHHRDNGDELLIHLDLKQAKIKLKVNGFDFKFRTINILKSPNIKYKLCVILDGMGVSVEILDFKTY